MKVWFTPRNYTEAEVRHGHLWLHADIECSHCGKNQPVAATHYVGGPCVRCGELTGARPVADLREKEKTK